MKRQDGKFRFEEDPNDDAQQTQTQEQKWVENFEYCTYNYYSLLYKLDSSSRTIRRNEQVAEYSFTPSIRSVKQLSISYVHLALYRLK